MDTGCGEGIAASPVPVKAGRHFVWEPNDSTSSAEVVAAVAVAACVGAEEAAV